LVMDTGHDAESRAGLLIRSDGALCDRLLRYHFC
jgi:hypothetical protein